MIGDIVQNSLFDAEELEREREVIMQELAQCTIRQMTLFLIASRK